MKNLFAIFMKEMAPKSQSFGRQDKKKPRQTATHRTQKKCFPFSRTRKATTAILRTQKSAFLFKDKESYDSDTSHAEKCFPFQGLERLLE
ncbi:hypothetical protein [Virgibacillus proomii]|uniref:hypothetical protein n=1 Tax=Virgibacillus proomii TaxID=84407 RepID=UPI001C1273D4|nr:hypothetical protein [Virgibacillus proomii]MBU5266826.1 hypothetical protein [Virgibacillus proomii]